MLRELTGSDWQSILAIAPEAVPEVLILRGTRNLRRHYLAFAEHLTDIHEIGSPNGLFEDVMIGNMEGRRVGYASVYGPAMASEITHVFGKMGTRLVILTGVCGALADDLQAGDVVVATLAGCGDGAVACYTPSQQTVDGTARLVDLVRTESGAQVCPGPIWTTAALLAEGMDDLERWHGHGFIAVDMETATTFGVAEWTGMERISVLTVFDNPRSGEHLGLDEHHKSERREAGEKAAFEIVRMLIRTA